MRRVFGHGVILLLAGMLMFQASPPFAASSAIADCDRLAASTHDTQRKSTGVDYSELDAEAAVRACAAAFKLDHDVPRIQYQYARSLGKAGQYHQAAELYRAAAEQGYTVAQHNLGILYYDGNGVQKDAVEAAEWIRKAAAQGLALSQALLGHLYMDGHGVPKNSAEAYQWTRMAAEQGLASAQDDLGLMYASGRGVARSDAEAVKWFRVAAEQGYANAQNNLGFMYHTGRGVEQNNQRAVNWFSLAAQKGNANAQNNIAIMYQKGEGVTQNNAEAVKWYRKSAAQGNVIAEQNLAHFSELKSQLSRGDVDAVNKYRKAAEEGDAQAAYNLGMSYLNGRGVLRDVYTARSWLGRSAMSGYRPASNMLSKLNQQQRELDLPQENDKKISSGALLIGVIIGGAILAGMDNDSGPSTYDPTKKDALDRWTEERTEDFNRFLLFGNPLGGPSF